MKKCLYLLIYICCFSCAEKSSEVLTVTVQNPLAMDRAFETVEIDVSHLEFSGKSLEVVHVETNQIVTSQVIEEKENTKQTLLFQPEISANALESYIIRITNLKEKTNSIPICYSRFVPERTDDYAWENNKVAFRTFGPKAQKMKEGGIKGGTLTSGMDAWLKRVEYPIINKWYAKHTSGKGSYHHDTGEGLDNFHVGSSRGVGGTAIQIDSSYATSKNFISYKTICTGSIRTSFILEYAAWDANGKSINETKHISLDYGQNLSRHVVKINGTNTLAIGVTLHKKNGVVATNLEEGWMSYWEPFDDSELGQGVVISKKNDIVAFDEYVTEIKDESNLYVNVNVNDNTVTYYTGFGWKKSNQFNSKAAWNQYLSTFSKCLQNPFIVKVDESKK